MSQQGRRAGREQDPQPHLRDLGGVRKRSCRRDERRGIRARRRGETKPPCANRNTGPLVRREINNWRDCLEALMAGDFLTATMIGLTFHDTIRFGWWQDRAALLERSWELRFANIMGIKQDRLESASAPVTCVARSWTCGPAEKRLWLPLLLLNGASAATGQRLMTTVLDSTTMRRRLSDRARTESSRRTKGQVARQAESDLCHRRGCTGNRRSDCPIFMEATRFHTLLTNEPTSTSGRAFSGPFCLNTFVKYSPTSRGQPR